MKKRINLSLSLIALVAILSATIGVTMVYYGLFRGQVERDLKQNARLLMETEVFQKSEEPDDSQEARLNKLSAGNLRITWIDTDGTVLFDNDVSGLGNHLDRPEIAQAIEEGEGETVRRSDTMNMNTFYYALLLNNGTVLRVSTQAINIWSVLLKAAPVILGIAAVVLIICVLLGHFLTGRLMKPIEEMAENLDKGSGEVAYKELEPFSRKIRSQHEDILAAARSRQDFTANVSHELKTPITAISGYAELIENGLVQEEEGVHIASQIRKNSERLLSLVTDIIRLSELDHKEKAPSFEQMDLLSVARECTEDLKAYAAKKNVSLSCRGTAAGINGDRNLIREMIENLVQNGIIYNREGGSVEVFVSIKEGHPYLSVKDTGIGIEKDQTERIFERFYRVDKSRSRATGGTGLGLAIVKHIAKLHSAEIRVESQPGVGTEIEVLF